MIDSNVLVKMNGDDKYVVAFGDGVEPASCEGSDPRRDIDDARKDISGWTAGSEVDVRGVNCIGFNGGSEIGEVIKCKMTAIVSELARTTRIR